jgi:hypothetical protein
LRLAGHFQIAIVIVLALLLPPRLQDKEPP